MTDSDDFTTHPTAQNKYVVQTKPQTESILEKATKAAARRANAKRNAFSCYMCWKHDISFLSVYERHTEGPEQFVITCWKCKKHPRKKYASLEQVEKLAGAYPQISISSFETRIPRRVWPPEPPKPIVQNEAAREAWEKLFGKD